jgi:hypothetical protein
MNTGVTVRPVSSMRFEPSAERLRSFSDRREFPIVDDETHVFQAGLPSPGIMRAPKKYERSTVTRRSSFRRLPFPAQVRSQLKKALTLRVSDVAKDFIERNSLKELINGRFTRREF